MRFQTSIAITGGAADDPDPIAAPATVLQAQIAVVPIHTKGTENAPTSLGAILEGTAGQTVDVEVYVQDEGDTRPFGAGAPIIQPGDLRYYLIAAAQTLTVGSYTILFEGAVPSGKIYIRLINKPAADATAKLSPIEALSGATASSVASASVWPNGYISWPNAYTRDSQTELTIVAPIAATSDDNTFNLESAVDLLLDMGVNGAGGLDTGAFAEDFYDIYLIGDSTGTNATDVLAVIRGNSPVLPAGYDKSALIFVQGSSSTPAWYMQTTTPMGGFIRINYDVSSGGLTLVSAGTDTSYAAVDCNTAQNYVPLGVKCSVRVNASLVAAALDTQRVELREVGYTNTSQTQFRPGIVTTSGARATMEISTDTLATFEYRIVNATNVSIFLTHVDIPLKP